MTDMGLNLGLLKETEQLGSLRKGMENLRKGMESLRKMESEDCKN